jgi:hypothetical protein
VNSSAIPYCLPGKSVFKTQMSTARRVLDWSAASARLLFDGDDAVLRNKIWTPSRRGHRSLPAAASRFLCGQILKSLTIHGVNYIQKKKVYLPSLRMKVPDHVQKKKKKFLDFLPQTANRWH